MVFKMLQENEEAILKGTLMVTATYVDDERVVAHAVPRSDFSSWTSAVSWAAIFAGALAAAVLSLLLFVLGIGLGLSSISVWTGQGADGETIGWAAIIWLAFTQLASAGVGGYIAGRLRTKWEGIHTDEVYFRDTAHGFLAWALATMLMVVVMGSVAGAAITGTAKAAGAVASGAAQMVGGAVNAAGGAASAAIAGTAAGTASKLEEPGSDLRYWVNGLLRRAGPTQLPSEGMSGGMPGPAAAGRPVGEEARDVAVIFTHSLQAGTLSTEDAAYLGRVVAEHTGVTPEEGQKNVQRAFDQVKQQAEQAKQVAKEAEEKAKAAAEQARKASAYSMLWMFVALLMGAFVGSVTATLGGRQRDA